MRIAKAMAHAGLCSRRDAERWIGEGRVAVNGTVLTTPAYVVKPDDKITVDGKPLPKAEAPRLWRYNKPKGLVTSHKDPQGRKTVFEASAARASARGLGGAARPQHRGPACCSPPTASLRDTSNCRAPAGSGAIACGRMAGSRKPTSTSLAKGITIDGVHYGPVEAKIDREQGSNVWLTLGLREGKNREVKRLAEALGLTVNRLIRISFGPFALGDLPVGQVEEVKSRVLMDQLGGKLTAELGLSSENQRLRAARRR